MTRLDSPEHAALRAANPVCGECGHGHPAPPAVRACPDHTWTDGCPYYGLDCPPAEERARITAQLVQTYASNVVEKQDPLGPDLPLYERYREWLP